MEIIRKKVTSKCYMCNGIGQIKRKRCSTCNGTGFYVETFYHHIYKGKDGKKYCIDGDTLK